MSNLEPKIYIVCLASYNAGILHGTWIDVTQDAEIVREEINALLASSSIPNAEEWEIQDYEGFGEIIINPYENIESLVAIAHFIKEHGILGTKLIAYSGDFYSANGLIEECYQGEYDNEEDFARSITEETMDVPDRLAYYIDYAMISRDLFISDYVSFSADGKIHVFNCY
jgi:antirestriction protein